jgi:hypothetical protein
MTLYRCDNNRPVRASGEEDAAEIFASREARRQYGRRAIVATLNLESRSQDRRTFIYSAFIGVPQNGGTAGRNVRLYIHAEP